MFLWDYISNSKVAKNQLFNLLLFLEVYFLKGKFNSLLDVFFVTEGKNGNCDSNANKFDISGYELHLGTHHTPNTEVWVCPKHKNNWRFCFWGNFTSRDDFSTFHKQMLTRWAVISRSEITSETNTSNNIFCLCANRGCKCIWYFDPCRWAVRAFQGWCLSKILAMLASKTRWGLSFLESHQNVWIWRTKMSTVAKSMYQDYKL